MKSINFINKTNGIIVLLVFCLGFASSCSDGFLETTPTGALAPDVLENTEALDAMLVAVYAALDGSTGGLTFNGWTNDHSNWLYGDVASDDALKGSSISDQPEMNPIELWSTLQPNNSYMEATWASIYEGVARANGVLQVLKSAVSNGNVSDADAKRIEGEARYLRGHFHHWGRKYFNRIPYIDETITDFRVPNDRDIFPDIEADYLFAIANLPVAPLHSGSAHVNAARASLAKLYMGEDRFSDAKPLLDAIISSGRYKLHDEFSSNFFTTEFETNTTDTEAIFQTVLSLNDPGSPRNGNFGRAVNGIAQLHGCCGFLQPSQNLVNAYETDANGLPLLDTFNNTDLKNDYGIASSEPFIPTTANLDPRLDYTVGRRGIPYLDFGNFPGKNWVVDQTTYGPYRSKKFLLSRAQQIQAEGGFLGATFINYSFHRYADILLLRAEVAVEEGDLSIALNYVNMVRNRAKNSTPVEFPNGTPAANYVIEPYPSFPSQDYARKAVRFERRLELAQEGHRWYDLVRWGIAQQVMTQYFATEDRPLINASGVYKSDYLPIPTSQIEVTKDDDGNITLIQNPAYN